jgi:hypothetical protein
VSGIIKFPLEDVYILHPRTHTLCFVHSLHTRPNLLFILSTLRTGVLYTVCPENNDHLKKGSQYCYTEKDVSSDTNIKCATSRSHRDLLANAVVFQSEDEVGGTCRTHERDAKRLQKVGLKS